MALTRYVLAPIALTETRIKSCSVLAEPTKNLSMLCFKRKDRLREVPGRKWRRRTDVCVVRNGDQLRSQSARPRYVSD